MGKLVTVKSGYNQVLLPGSGKVFNSGQTWTLTDAEYAGLASATVRAITVTTSGLADPVRTPLGSPLNLADALVQAKAYADTQTGSLTGAATTTAPSAGGGSALPATPAGYITVNINGTNRQIAYY